MPPPTEAELLEFCRSHLAHYKCPRAVDFVDACRRPEPENPEKRSAQEILAGQETLRSDFKAPSGGSGSRLNQMFEPARKRSTSIMICSGPKDASRAGCAHEEGVLVHGFELNCGRKSFSRRTPRLARSERPERLGPSGAKNPSKNPSPICAPGNTKLQEGRWAAVSWPKEYGGRSATLMQQATFLGRDGARRSPAHGQFARPGPHRPHHHCLRHRSAKKTLHPENSQRRRNLVPGLFRAERRLRPRRPANRSASSKAIITSSTAKKSGPATAGSAIGANSSCAPIPPPQNIKD